MDGIEESELPWYGRAGVAIGLGALIGLGTELLPGRPGAILLFAAAPAIAAANLGLADHGRRPLSLIAAALAAAGTWALVNVLRDAGAALASLALGALCGARVVRDGPVLVPRRVVIAALGGFIGPCAVIAGAALFTKVVRNQPTYLALAAVQALFWVPLAGAEAALAWSATRSSPGGRERL